VIYTTGYFNRRSKRRRRKRRSMGRKRIYVIIVSYILIYIVNIYIHI